MPSFYRLGVKCTLHVSKAICLAVLLSFLCLWIGNREHLVLSLFVTFRVALPVAKFFNLCHVF